MNTPDSTTRQGVNLRLFMHTDARHSGKLLYEWLLQLADSERLAGCSVFRAVAGCGRHGVLYDESFQELSGRQPMVVEFIIDESGADRIMHCLREAGVELAYTRTPIQYGVLGAT